MKETEFFYPFLVIYKQLQFLTNFPASKSLENCVNFSKLWSKSFSEIFFKYIPQLFFGSNCFCGKFDVCEIDFAVIFCVKTFNNLI